MFHRKDQIVFSKDSISSVLEGHSKPDICLPTRKNKSRTLWIFHKSLYYCPVKEHKGYQIPLLHRDSFKNSGALQKPSSASRTLTSNCLQGLSLLSLRREICNCPIALNTPRKTYHCSVLSHLQINSGSTYPPNYIKYCHLLQTVAALEVGRNKVFSPPSSNCENSPI